MLTLWYIFEIIASNQFYFLKNSTREIIFEKWLRSAADNENAGMKFFKVLMYFRIKFERLTSSFA